ncbi:hypothetical protein BV25DRAFT_1854453 [Artomyces pyxidatus]|uniref:Uncharacterized protein n=1 Tax=Artomyces pyxidatus TaxID=48021 RepID=A0ACB8T3U3_9AGAM|nr:hypothetical protein BV25DRAFT_1854453 [Artomyces pyxidatus]
MAQEIEPVTRHEVFFFDDGTLNVRLASFIFRIHRTILVRHSPHLASMLKDHGSSGVVQDLTIPEHLNVTLSDFETLLEYLYHDAPLDSATPFPRLAALVRVTSPSQLDIPSIQERARTHIAALFPGGHTPFAHLHPPEHLEPALELAMHYDLGAETKKALLYSVSTSTNFDPAGSHDPAGAEPHDTSHPSPHPALTPRTLRICHRLLASIIEDFTPVLFTVGAAGHMECTDVLADHWMTAVISPALADGGVGRPLEELARISEKNWSQEGVCDACVIAKRKEWDEVAGGVWESVSKWVVEAEQAEGN